VKDHFFKLLVIELVLIRLEFGAFCQEAQYKCLYLFRKLSSESTSREIADGTPIGTRIKSLLYLVRY